MAMPLDCDFNMITQGGLEEFKHGGRNSTVEGGLEELKHGGRNSTVEGGIQLVGTMEH